MIGGPLSGWIMNHFAGVHGWSGWQWMFVIEAVPTVIVGLLVLTYLKDGVHQATWLSDDEKALTAYRPDDQPALPLCHRRDAADGA